MAFAIDDVVRFKAGGPKMLVRRINEEDTARGPYLCRWFEAGGDDRTGHFSEGELESAQDDE